jgi:hypothetical protein
MPLVRSLLEEGLFKAFDAVEMSEEPIAGRWADALEKYLTPVVPPSATVSSGCADFKTAWTGFSKADQFRPTLSTQLVKLAATMTTSMITQANPAAAPPPSPPNLPTGKFIGARPAAVEWSKAIHDWFKTGTSTAGNWG